VESLRVHLNQAIKVNLAVMTPQHHVTLTQCPEEDMAGLVTSGSL
jgi:hypothetical protein